MRSVRGPEPVVNRRAKKRRIDNLYFVGFPIRPSFMTVFVPASLGHPCDVHSSFDPLTRARQEPMHARTSVTAIRSKEFTCSFLVLHPIPILPCSRRLAIQIESVPRSFAIPFVTRSLEHRRIACSLLQRNTIAHTSLFQPANRAGVKNSAASDRRDLFAHVTSMWMFVAVYSRGTR